MLADTFLYTKNKNRLSKAILMYLDLNQLQFSCEVWLKMCDE